MLQMLVEESLLPQGGGLSAPSEPLRIATAIMRRLAVLPPEQHLLLDLLCITGCSLEESVLAPHRGVRGGSRSAFGDANAEAGPTGRRRRARSVRRVSRQVSRNGGPAPVCRTNWSNTATGSPGCWKNQGANRSCWDGFFCREDSLARRLSTSCGRRERPTPAWRFTKPRNSTEWQARTPRSLCTSRGRDSRIARDGAGSGGAEHGVGPGISAGSGKGPVSQKYRTPVSRRAAISDHRSRQ